jgi:hypothetical protein
MLDDYVSESNPVRVVDVFVDELDLGKLGFEGVDPAVTGRPGYHPASLLKIYVPQSAEVGQEISYDLNPACMLGIHFVNDYAVTWVDFHCSIVQSNAIC